MNGRKLLIAAILVFVAMGILFYRFYDGAPGPLPSADEAASALNKFDTEADASVVLDMVRLDDRQIFVPYVSRSGNHGMGFMEWKKRKWNVTRVDTSGRPELRILDHSNPADRFIVWNINPLHRMEEIRFYLIRDRNIGRTNGVDYYVPRVQMEQPVSMTEHPYGALPLPEAWAGVMKEEYELNQSPDAGVLGSMLASWSPRSSMLYVGWIPRYAENSPQTHSGYSKGGGEDTEFIMILNEADLEKP